MADPIFDSPLTNPFGLSDVGRWAHPTFADIDSDGDLDAIIGNLDGNILFYNNLHAITGTANADILVGTLLGDLIRGLAGNDTLDARAGDDVLDGGRGADTMSGGVGDDRYIVDSSRYKINEALAAGIDSVQSTASYTLSANVENLWLTGVAAINGTGNALDNSLTGNAAANTLTAYAGADTLDGLVGTDSMRGGLGNDSYVVDNSGDVVTETSTLATEIDTVNSSITYTLGANLENLTLIGDSHYLSGYGNTLNNILTGNRRGNFLNGHDGDDSLMGGSGNDHLCGDGGNDVEKGENGSDVLEGTVGNNTLDGGFGNDALISGLGDNLLTGGEGHDIFRFVGTSNSTISDFVVAEDTIQLQNRVFTQLSATGVLSADHFKIGVAADADDYVIYKSGTGALLYDADGNGAGAAVQIAVLGAHLALTHADIFVV